MTMPSLEMGRCMPSSGITKWVPTAFLSVQVLYSRLAQVKELCNGASSDGSSYHVSHIGLVSSFP